MNKRKVRITNTGYLPDSPDRNNEMNIIPSNQITMKNVPFPILGVDNMGNQQMMMPGGEYSFPGQYVTEIPMGKYQKGKQVKQREVVYTDPAKYMRANEAYRDSSILYDAYQFQKANAAPGYTQWLNRIGSSFPGGADALRKTRQKHLPLGSEFFDKESRENNFYADDSTYDPSESSEKPIVDYYKKLIGNNKNFRISKHNSPDLWHRRINPIGEYVDGSFSPIYKKPEVIPVMEEELKYIEPRPIGKLPVSEPQLIPIDYSSFKTTKPRTLDAQSLDQTQRTGQYNKGTYYYNQDLKRWQYRPIDQEDVEYNREKGKVKKQQGGGIYMGDYEFKDGGLVKYQKTGEVNIAGTNEMWIPSESMSPQEAKQWGSLRGDALPIIGSYASNNAIYKAYDFAKSKDMDYNQYIDWLKGNTEASEKSFKDKHAGKTYNYFLSKTTDPSGKVLEEEYDNIPYSELDEYADLPGFPFAYKPETDEYIYLGEATPHKYKTSTGNEVIYNDYVDPMQYMDVFNDIQYGLDNAGNIGMEGLLSDDPNERKKYFDDLAFEDYYRDVKDPGVSREQFMNYFNSLSYDDLRPYSFDWSIKAGDSPELQTLKLIRSGINGDVPNVLESTKRRGSGSYLNVRAYPTDAEAKGAEAARRYEYESMNTPLAKFLGAEPGKVNPNVAKRAAVVGSDVAAKKALSNISNILGNRQSDTEEVRHMLQNPDAYRKQLEAIINSPFNLGTISLDETGSNKLKNISLSKEEAQNVLDNLDLVSKSPKYSYMSEATPQDKFIQGTGLGWFLPTSEAAKDANLLDAVGAPFELAGNVLGNYINAKGFNNNGMLMGDEDNEFPTASPRPLAYSVTDPAGAALLNGIYKTGLDVVGTEGALKMLSGLKGVGKLIMDANRNAYFNKPLADANFSTYYAGETETSPVLKELRKSLDENPELYGNEVSQNNAYSRLFTDSKTIKRSPLNKKKKLISVNNKQVIVEDTDGMLELVNHPDSGLSSDEIKNFISEGLDKGTPLYGEQLNTYYKAQLNQYGTGRVDPKNLTWQQRLKNQFPFTGKTKTFYDESKIAKSDNKYMQAYYDFANNPTARDITEGEYNLQKKLFNADKSIPISKEAERFNRGLGYSVRDALLRGTKRDPFYQVMTPAVNLGLLGFAGVADKAYKFTDNYVDPYLNPILNKLGISTSSATDNTENLSIDLSEEGSELTGVQVNQQDLPEDFNIILGGEFIYENPNSVQTAKFYRENPDFQVGDNKFKAKDSKVFYGIEDGKLVAGTPEQFKSETIIIPTVPGNENDFTPISKAGMSEAGLRLVDKDNQPIYQTAGMRGKILLYSPKTGKSYFVYNSGENIEDAADKINRIIQKDPDVRSITIDNGRYDYYLENKDGLTDEDFQEYYEADLQRQGNPGYNLILKRPKKQHGGLIKAQKGLPTAADSLDVMNSSLAAQKFYLNNGYSLLGSNPSKLKSNTDLYNELQSGRRNFKNNLARGIRSTTGADIINVPNNFYSKPGKNKYQTYQREQASGIINTNAPHVLYDERILPQVFNAYTNENSPTRRAYEPIDSAGIYTYDKLATTPWNKLSTKQKKQRLQKFGTNGTPYKTVKDGLNKLNTTVTKEVVKEPELERIPMKEAKKFPVAQPQLEPINLNLSKSPKQREFTSYQSNQTQRTGQVAQGKYYYDNELKKWQYRPAEQEEIDYQLDKGRIKQLGGGIYLGDYEFKDGGLVKYQKGEQVSFDDYMMQALRPQGAARDNTHYTNARIQEAQRDEAEGVTLQQKQKQAALQARLKKEELEKKKQQLLAEEEKNRREADQRASEWFGANINSDDYTKDVDGRSSLATPEEKELRTKLQDDYFTERAQYLIDKKNQPISKDIEDFEDIAIPALAFELAPYALPYVLGAGKAALSGTSKASRYLTTQTPLREASKYNPWAWKPDVNSFYHRNPDFRNVINQETGLLQSWAESSAGKEYSRLANIPTGSNTINLKRGANPGMSFSRGVPLDGVYNTSVYPGPYLVEVSGKTVPFRASVKGNAASDLPGKSIGSYNVPGRPISLDEAKFYKEHWLRGYVPVNMPYKFKDGGLVKYQDKGEVNMYELERRAKAMGHNSIEDYRNANWRYGENHPKIVKLRQEYPYTWKLAKGLPSVERYKDVSPTQWFDMLDMIAQAESKNRNIRQGDNGPGRGYYQFEAPSTTTAKNRAIQIKKDLKSLGYDLQVPERFDTNFMNLSKDEQAFYALSNLIKGASAKREGNPNYKIDLTNPGKAWFDLHWAGAEKHPEDVNDRIAHWNESNPNYKIGFDQKKQIIPLKANGGIVKAQQGLNKRMVRQYPGMKSVYGDRGENLNVIKDKNFIPSEYGYGDIEFIYPGSGLVTYNDEYAYQSPTPDKYTAVYNPKGANKHDVFLDMMHGMRHDPDYMELLNEFSQATRNARGTDMDYFFNQDAQEDPNFVIDGREQWDNNYIDGMVRAHMYKKASQQKHLPFVNPFGSKPHGTEDYEMELGPNSPEMYQAADQIYNYIKGDKNRSLKKVKIKSLPRKNQ